MNRLATLQRSFQRYLDGQPSAIGGAVLSTPAASAARRLGVYADAYRLRLIAVLESDFPALRAMLGTVRFSRLARDYVAATPSRHPNLRWYGARLPGFLKRSPGWSRRPALAELARFEWALGVAFDAADRDAVAETAVALVAPADWPGMRLTLHPSVQVMRLTRDAPSIRQALLEGGALPPLLLRRRVADWLVWREGRDPRYRSLPAAEARALRAVLRGADFAALCGGMQRFAGMQGAAGMAAQYLRNWLAAGLICGIDRGDRRGMS